ncbi:MAG: helix-turn-helix domain-containing protein [Fimbriimonadia bacterium]|jgi:excisionase family DNA binding protein
MDKLLLRVCEAAEVASVCRSKAYELAASGEWPTVRIGRSVRVHGPELLAWIDARVRSEGLECGAAGERSAGMEAHQRGNSSAS